jgi:hypothetical protein
LVEVHGGHFAVASRPGEESVFHIDDHDPALAGGDVQGVALPRLRLRPAVLVDHGHVHAVQVHGVDHHPLPGFTGGWGM